jgi:hypothetical protein
MAGEKSKSSGEIGEKLAAGVLSTMGWRDKLNNVSIPCNTRSHLNLEGNQKQSHGDDVVFLYQSPFHDDRTDIVHVSVKNKLDNYPAEQTLRTQFKAHIEDLHQTICCAKHDPQVKELTTAFGARKNKRHSGVLIWLQNDDEDIDKDIKPLLAKSKSLGQADDTPFYVIDNARATFLLKVVDDAQRRFEKQWKFLYPPIGTALKAEEPRTGDFLPLELVASEIVPMVAKVEGRSELVIYANQPFSGHAYKKLISYGLQFAAGLVEKIHIGMPNYNAAHDEAEATTTRLAFANRPEVVRPFSFQRSILDYLQEAAR